LEHGEGFRLFAPAMSVTSFTADCDNSQASSVSSSNTGKR
jgi:hypothetical protein